MDSPTGPSSNGARPADGSPAVARIVRNILALGTGQIFTWISATSLAVLLPRYLGDEHLGKLALALAFTSLFGLVARLGTEVYLTKELARDRKLAASYAFNAVAMRVPLMAVVAVLAVGTVQLLGYDDLTRDTVYLMLLATGLEAVYNVLVGSLQGLQEMRHIATAQVVSKFAQAAAVAAVLLTGHGLIEVAAVWSVSAALGIAVTGFFLIREVGFRPRIDPRLWRTLFFGGLPFFIWQASLMVYGQIDVIQLSLFASDAVNGWYAAAYRIISIPVFLPAIIMTALFPALSAAARNNRPQFRSFARTGLHVVLLTTIPIALGMMVLSPRLIDLFGYPEEFSRSVPLVIILSLHVPIMGADMIIGTSLNALDKQRLWALTGVSAAVMNPVLNFILIPVTQEAYGNGAIGAATATVLTETFMMGAGLWLLPRDIFDRKSLDSAARCVFAGGLMVGAVWLIRDGNIFVSVAVGAFVYGAASLALGTLRLADVRQLVAYMRARGAEPSPSGTRGQRGA